MQTDNKEASEPAGDGVDEDSESDEEKKMDAEVSKVRAEVEKDAKRYTTIRLLYHLSLSFLSLFLTPFPSPLAILPPFPFSPLPPAILPPFPTSPLPLLWYFEHAYW